MYRSPSRNKLYEMSFKCVFLCWYKLILIMCNISNLPFLCKCFLFLIFFKQYNILNQIVLLAYINDTWFWLLSSVEHQCVSVRQEKGMGPVCNSLSGDCFILIYTFKLFRVQQKILCCYLWEQSDIYQFMLWVQPPSRIVYRMYQLTTD